MYSYCSELVMADPPPRRVIRQPKRFRDGSDPQSRAPKRRATDRPLDPQHKPSVNNPFHECARWHAAGLSPVACKVMAAIWDTEICGPDRPYQAKLSQDQQQRLMAQLVPLVARRLQSGTQTHPELVGSLRNVAKAEWPRRLALEDKARLRDSKATLWWAEGTDLVERATGELPVSIKLYVDAAGCGSMKQLEQVSGIDPDKVRMVPLDVRERALLKAAAESDGCVLVLIFIQFSSGPTNWRSKGYFTSHITRIDFKSGHSALYTDHAMSAPERIDFEHRSLFVNTKQKGQPVYSEPTTLPTAVKARPRPPWASASMPGVKQYHYSNLWAVRVFHLLQEELQQLAGIELEHNHCFALQSWDESQCAVAMLFDLHIGIPDKLGPAVVEAFTEHRQIKRQKRRLAEDKSANSTMLRLYEAWIASSHTHQFARCKEWADTNSLNVGDLQSCGVCDVCDQKDTPSCILLCAHEQCGRAMHCFCLEPPVPTPENYPDDHDWFCDLHTPAE